MARNRTPRFMNLFSPERRSARTDRWQKRFRKFSLSSWHSSRIVETVCSVFRSGAEAARAVSAATGTQMVTAASSRSLRLESLEDRRVLDGAAWNLAVSDFSQDWSNTGLITVDDNWTGVPSIIGDRGDGMTGGTGIDPQTVVGPGSGVIDVNANQTNPSTFTTGGLAEFQTKIFADNFDGYANQAAFEAAWPSIGSTVDPAKKSAQLSSLQSTSAPNSVLVPVTTTATLTPNSTEFRNRASFSESGVVGVGDQLVWSFDFYDSPANAATTGNPQRNFANLQDTTGPTSANQLVSMGLNNNQLAATSGGQFYMARILGYNPPAVDADGGPGEAGTLGSGAYFKLNDFGVGQRSTGWHNLKVVISTDDGLSTDYTFYVDGQLAERVSNVAGTFRSYDNITIGSGLTNGGVSANYDNMKVDFESAALANNPVVALQGSGTARAPSLNLRLDATGRENVTISYNVRDVDGSTDNSAQSVALQYRIGGVGNFVNVPEGYVADATSGPSLSGGSTAVTASLPAWSNAANLEFRILTTDAAGADEWIGIDDITITSTTLNTAHVDDDWVGLPSGTSVDSDGDALNGFQHAEIGFDAFATIQDGIDAVPAGGTVIANAGTYTADVVVNKAATLRSTSGAAATVIQGVSTGFGGAVRVTADDVTIGDAGQGFTINGAGESALYVIQGVDDVMVEGNTLVAANGKNSLLTEGGVNDLTFDGNTFDAAGVASQLVYVNGQTSVGIPSTNVDFLNNIFDGDATGPLLGLESTGGQVTGNQFNGATPYTQLELRGAGNAITGNTFSGAGGGSFLVDPFDAYDMNAIVANNTFAGGTVVIERGGVLIAGAFTSIVDALAAAQSNDIIHVGAGTYIGALNISIDVTINGVGDSLVIIDADGANTGVDVQSTYTVTIEGVTVSNFSSTGVRTQGDLTLTDSTIDGGLVGVWVDGGTLDMQSTLVTNAVIFGVQVANGGQADISSSEISGTGTTAAGVVVSDGHADIVESKLGANNRGLLVNATGTASVTGSDLSGNSIGGVVNATATVVDASGNWWGSNLETAVDLSAVGAVDFSPYLDASGDIDGGARGFVGDFSYLHVTELGGQTGPDGRITEAVDRILDGALTGGSRLIDVHAGAYTGQVIVDQSVTLRGAQWGVDARTRSVPLGQESLIQANAVGDALVEVSAANVTIDGFSVDGSDDAFRAIRVNGVDFATVKNNIITGAVRGVQYNGAAAGNTGGLVTQNRISDLTAGGPETYGVLAFDASYASVTNNLITSDVGAFEQYFYQPNAGNVANFISGNQFNATQLGYGTNERASVASATALSGNTHNITGPGGVGVQLYNIYKSGGISLTNETITGADVGVYAFINGGSASITGGSIDGTDAPGSIGVHVTNYLTAFSDDAAANGDVTIDSVDISDFGVGVHVEDDALGAFAVHATITNDTNITSSGSAILVSGADASVDVTNNDDSISGNLIGIAVNGGSATVTNNSIDNNGTGVSISGGTANLTGNALTGNTTGISVTGTGVLTVGLSNSITGGVTGVLLSGPGVGLTGLTFGDLSIDASGDYITLANSAFDNQDLNAAGTTLGGVAVGSMTNAQKFAATNKITDEIDNNSLGLVLLATNTIFVTPASTPTATDNDYTRIKNAIEAAGDNWTIDLLGTFNWVESNAAASWALGNDGLPATADDYSILVAGGLEGVTLTASSGLGTAIIQGPGDLAAVDLEGFLYFPGGSNASDDNKGWTISNLDIRDFDLSIGMFNSSAGVDAFDNTKILNNRIRVATDLNATVAPGDSFQNIGIHYSFGANQTIQGNFIDIPGDGISDSANLRFASSVGMQSNTSGGGVYDGLLIDDNTITVLNAQSADPENILGIWENGHAHTSDITVSSNDFVSNALGNNPAANLQRAFRVTSHSGASSTVTYSGNSVSGANIGFQWIAGSNFAGNQAVQVTGNTLTNVNTGFLIQSNGVANLAGNSLTNSGGMAGAGIGVDVAAGSVVTIDGSVNENTITGFATGIRSAGTVTIDGNDASIHGNVVGVDVTGGTATISNNHIYDNSIGVRFATTGGGSLTNNNFGDGTAGDGLDDNATDLFIAATAGSVAIGASNDFAGDTFFIDNQSTQSYDLSANGTTFDEANNFRIEDKIHHRVDTDLALSVGLVTWVAGNLFVTTPSSTDSSIQRAIDAAVASNTVNIEAGLYNENLSISKAIKLLGVGAVTLSPSTGGHLVTIDGASFGGDNLVSITNIDFDGLAGLGDVGVRVNNTASFANLTIADSSFTGFDLNAVGVFGNAVTGLSVLDVDISNSTFANNGLNGGGGTGDLQFFEYNGDATLTGLDLVGSATATTGARLGIQFRGTGGATGVGVQAMGDVTLNDVDVSGDYRTQMIGIQRYQDVDDLTFTNVALGGATSAITGGFGASLRFDAVGFGALATPETFSLGNTLFRGLDPLSAQRHEIEIAPDNSHTFLRVDGTGTTWTIGGIDVAASTLSLAQAFAVEDRILHYVDKLNPSHGAYKGFVDVKAGQAFITDNVDAGILGDGSIQRGIDVVVADGIVNVEAGTFAENLVISKEVNVIGAVNGSGVATTTLTPAGAVGDLIAVTGTIADVGLDGQGVLIQNFNLDGLAGTAGYGVRVQSTTSLNNLTVDNSNFTGFSFNAIAVFGNATTGLSVQDVDVTNSTFVDNGIAGGGGSGDLQFFEYNGSATLANLDLSNTGAGSDAHLGIQFRGVGAQNGTDVLPMGAISLTDVDISGLYVRQMIGLQRYDDAPITFNDVRLGGVGSAITGTFGAALRIDAVGDDPFATPSTIDLGDTYFRGVGGLGLDVEIAPDGFGFLRADATDTRWDTTLSSGQTPDNLTLAEQFKIEDRILHYVDLLHPNPLFGAFDGFVETIDGEAFVTTTQGGSIQRGVDVVDLAGTVNVANGTFVENVTIPRNVTVLSQSGRASTTIQGVAGVGALGTIVVTNNTTDVNIGGVAGRGFTIIGIDNGNPGIENAAVYFQGGHSGADVRSNDIVANGDAGLMTESGQTITNFNIDNNIFSGTTFIGTPADLGFANQFTTPNVPRQLVVMGSGAGNTLMTNLQFTNNQITGAAGGINGALQEQGNTLVTVDGLNTNISGNTFSGTTNRFGHSLRARGANNTITDNVFNSATMGAATVDVYVNRTGNVIQGNTFTSSAGAAIHVDNLGGATIGGTGVGQANSISNYTAGILVTGPAASAVIDANAISSSGVGIDVSAGTALVQNANLNGNAVGVRILNGGVADLGQVGPGLNYTGLGVSSGGNDFTGYTAAATASSGAIVNLNTGGAYSAAGQQGYAGPAKDVAAFNNLWNVSTPAGIENVIWHDADDVNVGFIDYASLSALVVSLEPLPTSVTNEPVNEGSSTTVYGQFVNDAQSHQVTITWGDGSPNTVVTLLPGVTTFAIASPAATYTDDPNGPVQTILRNISVTVEEVATPANFLTDNSLSVNVNNVIPDAALSTLDGDLNEGETLTLDVGPAVDPGADTVQSYRINWGDGTNDLFVGNLSTIATHTHQYLDGLASPNVTVTLDLFDEDGTWNTVESLNILVHNVDPTAGGFFSFDAAVNEGSTTTVFFIGPFTDPGSPDSPFHFAYDFNGNGIYGEAGELGDGTYAGSSTASTAVVPAQFLADDDDSPRTVNARIIDNDGGFTEYMASIVINNVAPVVNAGADSIALAGVPFMHTVNFTDPGADAPWTVNVDWNGDGDFLDADEAAFGVGGHSFTISHTYSVGEIGNIYNVKVQVDDNDGGVDDDVFQVTVVENTFRVTNFVTYASGFDVTFNQAADLGVLNLYSGQGGPVTPPDVTLVGASVGAVKGSIVWNPTTNTLSFVKTGGVLVADTYTVTLVSGDTAFQNTLGSDLDGDGNFTPGGNYTNGFAVTSSGERVVSVQDFARGAGQDVDLPIGTSPDFHIRIDNAAGVTAVDVDVVYDPALLNITGAFAASGLPGGWSITTNFVSPGLLKLTLSGTTPLVGSNLNLIRLVADVPATAPYGASQVVRLEGLRVNEDALASKADYAVHKAVYVGDADGDGQYLGVDSSRISRVVVNLDSGFSAHPWTDPLIVADASGDGTLSGQDASLVAQEAALIDTPEIPPLPGIVLIPAVGGMDPELSVPSQFAAAGDTVTIPVKINVLAPEASDPTVVSATFDVFFNNASLSLGVADIAQGSFWTVGDNWSLTKNVVGGQARLVFFNSGGGQSLPGVGDIAYLTFTLDAGLTPGQVVPLDIQPVSATEGGLTWTNSDGAIGVTYTADFDLDGDVDGNDLGDWQAGFGTSPNATVGQGDEDRDGDVDGSDFLAWQRQLGSTVIATVAAVGNSAPTSSQSALGAEAAAVSVDAVAEAMESEPSTLQTASWWLQSPSISHHRSEAPARSRDSDAAFHGWSGSYGSAASAAAVAVVNAEDESDEFAAIEDLYQDQDDSEAFGNEFDEALLSWLKG